MKVCYFDSSALVKRAVREELWSQEFLDFLLAFDPDVDWVTSELATVECHRSLARIVPEEELEAAMHLALSSVGRVAIGEPVIERASVVGDTRLPSLDAIHLATALLVDADALVTYDDRLAEAARAEGIDVLMPGRA